jgi:hypothetical protein
VPQPSAPATPAAPQLPEVAQGAQQLTPDAEDQMIATFMAAHFPGRAG